MSIGRTWLTHPSLAVCFLASHPGYLFVRNQVCLTSPFEGVRPPPCQCGIISSPFSKLQYGSHALTGIFTCLVKLWLKNLSGTGHTPGHCNTFGNGRGGHVHKEIYKWKAWSHRKLIFRPNCLLNWSKWIISGAYFSDSLIAAYLCENSFLPEFAFVFALSCLSTLRS